MGVAGRAKRFSVPVIAIGGSVSSDYSAVYEKGIDAVFSITTRPMTLEEAYKVAEENIEMTTKNIATVWKIASENTSKYRSVLLLLFNNSDCDCFIKLTLYIE